ncbi:DNA pilot protein [Sigmofec virus UA08Rod_5625]|uniref:DNA pilot protein n=1 Tax=Sigmofec virus UA08Rod_5625 TaxID=2929432 RepID=A0A976N1J6_9VIRU|nr:DNA pilot protein [Sigmofec virus UA08Rod_5625]
MVEGILSGIASIGSGITNAVTGAKQLQFQRQVYEESKQREDTAVQRRAADMAAAGINKNLAAGAAADTGASAGAGAAAGAGGAAQMSAGLGAIGDSIGTAMQASKSFAEMANVAAQTRMTDTMSTLNLTKAVTEAKQQGVLDQEVAKKMLEQSIMQYDFQKSKDFGIRTTDGLYTDTAKAKNVLGPMNFGEMAKLFGMETASGLLGQTKNAKDALKKIFNKKNKFGF